MATSIAPWYIACFLIHLVYHPSLLLMLPDPSTAPWLMACNIHRSFHCSLIHRSFDLFLIHRMTIHQSYHAPWSIRILLPNPSLAPDPLLLWLLSDPSVLQKIHSLLSFWSITCFMINRSFHYSSSIAFDCFLIYRSVDSSLIHRLHLTIARSWSIAPVILCI